ncbi:hypothetical protein [Variovorax sp. GT1P44]|uniref:hypothetical protein n=1 Tax=Variovorax sp. GT1P44 TaxID=3443742 RepID=UPI003F451AF0
MRRKKTPTERIQVTDQVGKLHVVVKYSEYLEPDPGDSAPPAPGEVASEYRLATGRIVDKTGDDTFETSDGTLRLKTL